MSNYINFKERLIKKIDESLETNKRIVIAIDGHCAAGKTTLSLFLKNKYRESCSLIHMDHFFLPLALRTKERLEEPGGNIDYDRFTKEVINNLKTGIPFSYSIFNCSKMSIDGAVTIPSSSPLIVIEGSYSLHPKFGDYSNINIFMDINKEEQSRRILERNGIEQHKRFINEWIPMENLYFTEMKIKEKCGFIFTGST